MKKTLAVILSVLMILSTVFALSACGNKKNGSDNGGVNTPINTKIDLDKVDYTGEWTMDLTLSNELIKEFMGATGDDEESTEMFDYMDLDGLTMTMVWSFDNDGKVTMTPDKKAFDAFINKLIDVLFDGMDKYMKEKAGMSLSELAAQQGMSVAQLKEETLKQMNSEDAIDEMAMEGYYEFKDGKFYVAEDKDELHEDYLEYGMTDMDTIKLTKVVSKDTADDELSGIFSEALLPLILKRK